MLSVFLTPELQRKIKHDRATKKLQIYNTVVNYKKTKNKQDANAILQYLKPTIDAALKSFAPGQLLALRIQAAKLALSSVDSFDPSKNVLLSTHAFHNLQRLNRLRRLRLNIIHVPLGTAYMQTKLLEKSKLLLDLLGRLPTDQLLADATGVSVAKLNKLMTNTKTINDSSAVSDVTGHSTFYNKVLTDNDYLQYAYHSVGPILQKILLWSTGINGKRILSNQLIAAKLKLSPGAVSQRKQRIQLVLSLLRGML